MGKSKSYSGAGKVAGAGIVKTGGPGKFGLKVSPKPAGGNFTGGKSK